MDPSTSTILAAFNEKLPTDMLYAFTEHYRTIRSTASSTADTDVINVYLEESIEVYHNLLNRNFPRVRHASPLNARMPVSEGTHLLKSEADVLRLATLQLLRPVNIALEQLLPSNTRIRG